MHFWILRLVNETHSSPLVAAPAPRPAHLSHSQGDAAAAESPVSHPKLDKTPIQAAEAAAAAAATAGAAAAPGVATKAEGVAYGEEEGRVVQLARGSVESAQASREGHVHVSGSSVGRGSGALIPSKPVSPEIEVSWVCVPRSVLRGVPRGDTWCYVICHGPCACLTTHVRAAGGWVRHACPCILAACAPAAHVSTCAG